MRFSHDVHRRPSLSELGGKSDVLRTQPLDLTTINRPLRNRRRLAGISNPDACPSVARRCPFLDVRVIQPPLRSTAPFSPRGAASYSATIASLYAAVNERLAGRGAGSGTTVSDAASPSSQRMSYC